VLVGNTVMHHLFSALRRRAARARTLSVSPSRRANLQPHDLGWPLPSTCTIRFARCIGGFVGSDILAGILSDGHRPLATISWRSSTSAPTAKSPSATVTASSAHPPPPALPSRPALFAWACAPSPGAIAYVALTEDGLAEGTLRSTIIGDVAPRGICGSGLVDAVAAGLRSGSILSNGRIADGSKIFPVAPPVVLYQSDIRELQLAKGAIAAGFRLLLKRLGAQVSSLHAIDLAGAFGNYVQIESALRIGLLEAPHAIIHAAGNTALRGAKMLLLADEPQLPTIEHVSLAADPAFQDEFANCMTFPGEFVAPVS
jgi:uncharacterized 2Fe-2S/4Fe-4S cluster protein (DUF4445 family)